MKKLLIISSTKKSNLDLSIKIKNFIKTKDVFNCEVVSLEDFELPLYTPTLEAKYKTDNSFPNSITKIKDLICSSNAMIWCSPEYNGGISPIVTNAIAWISRATKDWKEGFDKKNSLICTSSGGNGKNYVQGFSMQLNYLGSIVFEKSIIKTSSKDCDDKEFSDILNDFCSNI
ncbi:MAG: hypothetical protein CBC25_01930 [Pelagibacteraceae bacterium TMED65]|nr:hypothetical protein [Rickettsiales bacterium]OUU52874.1 MAG: hypothetical protein CBC25_01930 [Pelagibacteraceae bacterium TMED65]|tara:strand:+ start:472 stop:990 length:519 start_codon:yes stop_codon:yes gene_type:complete